MKIEEVKEYKDKNIRKIYTPNNEFTLETCPFNKWHPFLKSHNCFNTCHKRIRIDFEDNYKICVITCKIHD